MCRSVTAGVGGHAWFPCALPVRVQVLPSMCVCIIGMVYTVVVLTQDWWAGTLRAWWADRSIRNPTNCLRQVLSALPALAQATLFVVRVVLTILIGLVTMWWGDAESNTTKALITMAMAVGVLCGACAVWMFSRGLTLIAVSKPESQQSLQLQAWLFTNDKWMSKLYFAAALQPSLLTLLESGLWGWSIFSAPVVGRTNPVWRWVWLGDTLTTLWIGGGQVGCIAFKLPC